MICRVEHLLSTFGWLIVDLALSSDFEQGGPMRRRQRQRLIERLAALFPGMAYILDLRSRRISYIDPGLARLLGQDPDNFSVWAFRRSLSSDDVKRLKAHYRVLGRLAPGQSAEVILSVPGSDEGRRWLKIRSRPLARGRNGGVRRIIGLVVDVSQDHSTSEALQATSRRLVNAEESERRRIGRELHDSTIQHLVAIDLLLGGLEQRPELREDHFVLEMRETLGSVQREIRTFAFLLHPPNIDEQGLEQTLRRFCAGFARRTGLTIELDMRLGGARLSFDAEVALFRIAQEALMNIHRHAQATMVALHLKASPREVVLVVADDGVGMSSAELASAMRGAGVGVGGMRARMVQLGGALSLESNSAGLTVRARLPLNIDGPH